MGRRWVLPVLFLLLAPAYFLTLSSPAVGTFHDDGIYLVTAKALAEEGEYAISSLPDALPQTKYPVLFPLMLAGVWWLDPNFPANVLFLKLIPFTATIVWLLLAGLLLRRLGSSRMEAGTIALFALASPWTLYLSTSLLSDIPFAMFVTGALFLLEADPDVGRVPNWLRPFLIGAVSGLAYLVATRGITLLAAAVAVFLLRRAWRSIIGVSVGFAICALPWTLWQAANAAPSNPAYWYYSKLNYQSWHIFGDLSLYEAARVVLENTMNCFALPQVLWGLSSSAVNIVVIYVITWSLTLFALVGFAATARQRIRAVHLWTVIYLALIVSWIWTPNRFLVPILPLYLYFLVAGVRYVHSRVTWDARAAKALVWTFLVIAFSTSAYRVARDASIAVREHSATLFGEEPDNWPATMELMAWLRQETGKEVVVGSYLDPVVYLYSGRKAIRPFRVRPYPLCYEQPSENHALGDVEEFRSHLLVNRVAYIHISPMARFRERRHLLTLIWEASKKYPGLFRIAKQASDSRYFILKVDLARLHPEKPCQN